MHEPIINRELHTACTELHQAFQQNPDSLGFEELSTTELMVLQGYINQLLIERFEPLKQGIKALMKLESDAFNAAQK